jgi:hypothetical protein
LGTLGATVGVVLFIIGIIDLLVGFGCFKGWSWVWIIGIIIVIINVLIWLVSLVAGGNAAMAIFGIIIAIIIGWYLFQPQVKAWFGVT